jgi:hypothetical protein
MNSYIQKNEKWILTLLCSVAIATLVIALSVPSKGYAAQAKQKAFVSPEDAVKALINVLKAENMKELRAIFGPAGKDVLSSGDAVEDRAGRERFIKAYEDKNTLIKNGDAKAVLQIGTEEWPFPIPIIKKDERWVFDTKEGKEELLNRRIGRNELNTIQTCLAYFDAQGEYARRSRGGRGLLEYAQKIISTPGKKDGLYWEVKGGEEESPLGDFAAKAALEGYKRTENKPVPYHGYFFRVLNAQGKNAAGGAYDYIVDGKMIAGFGMVAYPAQYGVSGIMTFVVNHEGVVYEKDLGRETAKTVQAMKLYDPDRTWRKAEAKAE